MSDITIDQKIEIMKIASRQALELQPRLTDSDLKIVEEKGGLLLIGYRLMLAEIILDEVK